MDWDADSVGGEVRGVKAHDICSNDHNHHILHSTSPSPRVLVSSLIYSHILTSYLHHMICSIVIGRPLTRNIDSDYRLGG